MSDVKKIATRESFGNALAELGKEHPEVVVLDADLAGATKTGVFKKAFPERHIDCGIAECNMMGIAAGLALSLIHIFGRRVGMTAGAVGMGLFDLLSGWAAWAPFTAVIAGTMGYVVGAMTEKHRGFAGRMAAVLAACLIKIAGYYAAEGILYGSWTAPLLSLIHIYW